MSDERQKVPYWFVDTTLRVAQEPPVQEQYDAVDEARKEAGNYFLTRTEAVKSARALRAALRYIHGQGSLDAVIENVTNARKVIGQMKH